MWNKKNNFSIKIITKILILLSIFLWFWIIQNSYAASWENIVEVTEKIPWANCEKQDNWLYKCTTWRWFWAIMSIMWKMLKYFTYLVWLFAVLSLVVWWVMYSMWWANEGMKTKAKDYIQTSLIW
jgi:hypothetical protein